MSCRCPILGPILAECECDGRIGDCVSCAGTGLRPVTRAWLRFEPAVPSPCPTHAPHDYRIWLARGSVRECAHARNQVNPP